MPTVSVVIPAKNRAKMIGKCLDSVLNQTVKADEIIVVDDNSTDNTKEIVQSYQQYGVKYIPLENKTGAQAARNLGIISATGDYIAFQDSDDEWFDYKLEEQTKLIKSYNSAKFLFIHGDAEDHDCKTGKRRERNVPELEGNCYEKLLKSPGPLFPAILVDKKALLEIGLLDEKVPSWQEWDTAISLSKICEFKHVKKPLFTYNLNHGETISLNIKRDLDGYGYLINKYKNEILRTCGKKSLLQHLNRQITVAKKNHNYFKLLKYFIKKQRLLLMNKSFVK
jgi:glycosyltransferase involved in cell wall biosynthesis